MSVIEVKNKGTKENGGMVNEKPHNYSKPDWRPLEAAVRLVGLPDETCAEFMWMYEDGRNCHHYKHLETRRYVHFTHQSARILARDGIRDELAAAMGATVLEVA